MSLTIGETIAQTATDDEPEFFDFYLVAHGTTLEGIVKDNRTPVAVTAAFWKVITGRAISHPMGAISDWLKARRVPPPVLVFDRSSEACVYRVTVDKDTAALIKMFWI